MTAAPRQGSLFAPAPAAPEPAPYGYVPLQHGKTEEADARCLACGAPIYDCRGVPPDPAFGAEPLWWCGWVEGECRCARPGWRATCFCDPVGPPPEEEP